MPSIDILIGWLVRNSTFWSFVFFVSLFSLDFHTTSQIDVLIARFFSPSWQKCYHVNSAKCVISCFAVARQPINKWQLYQLNALNGVIRSRELKWTTWFLRKLYFLKHFRRSRYPIGSGLGGRHINSHVIVLGMGSSAEISEIHKRSAAHHQTLFGSMAIRGGGWRLEVLPQSEYGWELHHSRGEPASVHQIPRKSIDRNNYQRRFYNQFVSIYSSASP